MHKDYFIRPARWPDDRDAIRRVREAVFVHEQGIASNLEWDGRDAEAWHVLACQANDTPIATGRLLPDGRIGRMAVLAPHRGLGVGGAMLSALLEAARAAGQREVWLSAQIDAVPFYAQRGFTPQGATYIEAGIVHQKMRRVLG